MKKRYILALFSFLAIFLVSACGQEAAEPKNTESVQQTESSNSEKPEQTSKDSSSQKNDEAIDTRNHIGGTTQALPKLKVHYIDVGQADSSLLHFSHDGEDFTILIDAGNWNRNDVIPYLQSQNVSQIDIAIGTHPDADHIGQLNKVINTFDVGEVWLSGNTSSSQTFQKLLTAIDSHDVDYYEPRMGDEFEIGPLEIDVLYPKTITENDNEESISLKITYGDVRFIFTGDASRDDEIMMLDSGFDLKADILHLGHHGSKTSTHPSFLKKINPAVAIYSAGKDNSYGHPHAEVVNLVQSSNIKLYGTDIHGTIIVTTDGKDYNVLTKNDGTISPSSSKNQANNQQNSKSSSKQAQTNGKIDINTATFEEVQKIIHIGPSRAQDLIDGRPYNSVDDLSKIKGIGPARIKNIKEQGLATVGG